MGLFDWILMTLRGKMKVVCDECFLPFEINKNEYQPEIKYFCSPICSLKYSLKNNISENTNP